MKIRNGFVSNSSSSSFICDVCGNEQSGMDLSLSECEMNECKNGHTFCDEHKIEGYQITIAEKKARMLDCSYHWPKEEVEKMDDDTIEEEYGDYFDDDERYECSEKSCPICQFQNATVSDIAAYYLKKAGVKPAEIVSLFKEEFGDYSKLAEFIKKDEN